MTDNQINFTCHEKTAYKGFVGALFFVAILETAGVSFLLYGWNLFLHYLHLGVNVLFMLFLWVDTKKVVNQPIWVQDRTLHLAVGLRPKIVIPFENIQQISNGSGQYEEKRKDKDTLDLSIFVMEEPTLLIELNEPITCHTLFGKKKAVQRVFFFVDEKEQLVKLLRGEQVF